MAHPTSHLVSEEELEKLVQILNGEDQLGLVARCHLYLERELIAFIEKNVSPPEILKSLDLKYHQYIKVALALGLDPSLKKSLDLFGRIRNGFAHDLDSTIPEDEVSKLELESKNLEILRGVVRGVMPASSIPGDLASPRLRFTVLFIELWFRLRTVVVEGAS